MISQDMISDEHFNSISIEAQNIFIRMLSVSDDCGVVPANTYRLNVLINTPPKLTKRIRSLIQELVDSGLGYLFEYHDEEFFAFKPSSFEDYQSYILKKSTKSEYLRIPKADYEQLSKSFQELPRISGRVNESAVSTVESREQRVDSNKQKAESKEGEFLEIPDYLLSEWEEFRAHRKEIKKPMTARAEKILLENLKNKSPDIAKLMILQSIANGWQGIFELKENGNGANRQNGSGNHQTRPSPTVEAMQRTLEKTERRIAARNNTDNR